MVFLWKLLLRTCDEYEQYQTWKNTVNSNCVTNTAFQETRVFHRNSPFSWMTVTCYFLQHFQIQSMTYLELVHEGHFSKLLTILNLTNTGYHSIFNSGANFPLSHLPREIRDNRMTHTAATTSRTGPPGIEKKNRH